MARLSSWLLFLVVVLPSLVQLIQVGRTSVFVKADADEAEGEEDGAVEDDVEATTTEDEDSEEPGDDDAAKKNVHSNADTTLVFVNPLAHPSGGEGKLVELPAGQIVEFMVGFGNKGDDDEFVVETLDASFRYPMDFSYHIQNFSAVSYQKSVATGQEASFHYSFIPADAFVGRAIGLTINLGYKDGDGNFYFDPVFNETVQIVEFDEGFDTEVFFMYVFLVAVALLVLFLVYSFVAPKTKGKKAVAKKPLETGTSNDDVDYEWIPRSALRTPGSSKTSPRQRKSKRNAGSDTE